MSGIIKSNGSPTQFQLEERRQYIRFLASMTVHAGRTEGGEITDLYPVELVNIGVGGASFNKEEPFAQWEQVVMQFPFPSENVLIPASVLSVKGTYHSVQFLFDPSMRARIERLVDAVVGKTDFEDSK